MVPGLYSVASSMRATERNHEVIASNLANASVPGYRRQVTSVESFGQVIERSSQGRGRAATGTQINRTESDFSPGELVHTGRPLDLALRGDGFFVLDGPKGPVYTR